MNKKVVIIGAGGQARPVINLLELNGFMILGIYDESYQEDKKELIFGYELKGNLGDNSLLSSEKIVLAIGDNKKRCDMFNLFSPNILKENLVHPKAVIEKRATLGMSNLIFAYAYINSGVNIGDNNILNTACVIEHESKIGNHNHISVGSIICGRSSIGDRCFIGAGAAVIDKICICSDVTIGSSSVVIEDIKEPGVYAGNPERKIK